ncbi:MAG: Stf0 family sulphotransferase [Alphaproteobacteria bacterium]
MNYFICATPRSGSTWFCSLLKSTGIAGKLESYFRAQDLGRWAAEWGLEAGAAGDIDFIDYVTAAQAASRTPNGVSCSRIMWGTLDEMLTALRPHYPDHDGTDAELMQRAFGPTRYIRLIRQDLVSQAVSRFRAELSDVWHVEGQGEAGAELDADSYDHATIHRFVEEAEAHNRDWQIWLDANQITPHVVTYEGLLDSPSDEIANVLVWLGLDPQAAQGVSSPNRRMADAVSADWVRRYNQDAAR